MHYIPSHTAKFSSWEKTIFKKTLKIRVATKRAATCQHETALFPFISLTHSVIISSWGIPRLISTIF